MKTTIDTTTPDETEIQHTAYHLWNQNGRPEGRDAEFWFAAIEYLKHHHASVPETIPAPTRARARRASRAMVR